MWGFAGDLQTLEVTVPWWQSFCHSWLFWTFKVPPEDPGLCSWVGTCSLPCSHLKGLHSCSAVASPQQALKGMPGTLGPKHKVTLSKEHKAFYFWSHTGDWAASEGTWSSCP